MEVSHTPSHPYRALADDIAAKVQRGDLKPGDQIPSVRALAKEYGVTTATAQKAVKQLTDDGYVMTVPGLGVFVGELSELGAHPEPVTLHTVIRQLDDLQAAVTDLADRVHRLERPGSR
ncbi:MAG: winged helix-turn-helix transcriptional regulator [Kutzneria sp.]|nr:winged helix-turn-helix transcriptional regulator [Kutzneria sp.]